MASPDSEELEYAARIDMIRDLSARIGEALDYVDWLAAATDIDEVHLEKLSSILDGEEVEH